MVLVNKKRVERIFEILQVSTAFQGTVRLMKSRLSELSTTNPEAAEMLCATGLDEVLKAIQNPQTTEDDIITAWLHVEEYTNIQVDVDDDKCAKPEDFEEKIEADAVSLQKQTQHAQLVCNAAF